MKPLFFAVALLLLFSALILFSCKKTNNSVVNAYQLLGPRQFYALYNTAIHYTDMISVVNSNTIHSSYNNISLSFDSSNYPQTVTYVYADISGSHSIVLYTYYYHPGSDTLFFIEKIQDSPPHGGAASVSESIYISIGKQLH